MMQKPFSRALLLFTSLLMCAVSPVEAVETRELHRYFAKVTVEVMVADRDPEEVLREHFPKNDPTVTLGKQRNTGLFEIGATGFSRKAAVERATELATSIKVALGKDGSGAKLVIRERAEPPAKPMDPKGTKRARSR
jgi:hypothetical protein